MKRLHALLPWLQLPISTNYNEILLSVLALVNSTMNNTERGSHFALAVAVVAVVVADAAYS